MTTRQERQEDDEENLVDRRKISPDSQRRIAEAIHHDDFKRAASKYFEILTGDDVNAWKPWRAVEGSVELSEELKEEHDDKTVVVDVDVGDETTTVRVSDGMGAYSFSELHDGEYDIDAEVAEAFEWDDESTERTTYVVENAELNLEEVTVVVDTEASEIGDGVEGPRVTITEIQLSEEEDDEEDEEEESE